MLSNLKKKHDLRWLFTVRFKGLITSSVNNKLALILHI